MAEMTETAMPEEAEAMPEGNAPESAEPPAEEGAEKEQNRAIAKKALTFLYGDQATYSAVIDLITKGKADIINTIGDAAGIILKKVDADGSLTMEQVQGVGVLLVVSLYELADKAGIFSEVSKEHIQKSFGVLFSEWAKKNPGRVDKQKLDEVMNSPEGQQAIGGQQAVQPAPEAPGLLGGAQ